MWRNYLFVICALLLEKFLLSETTYTGICSGCKYHDTFPSCEKCIDFTSEEGTLSFQCERRLLFMTSFTDLCSICNQNKENSQRRKDGLKFDCQECTKFALIKGDVINTDIIDSNLKECSSCPKCGPTTIDAEVKTEETTSRNQSPSSFGRASCPECGPTITTVKIGTEEGTATTKSPSSFESGHTITTVEVSTKEGTSRTRSASSFECASCPECGPTTIITEVHAGEGTSRARSSSFDMMSASNEELQKIKDNLFGYMFGAAIGGALLGSIITAFVFICLRRRTARQKVREPESDALQNLAEGGVMEQLVQDQDTKNRVICNEINSETLKTQEESAEFKPDEVEVYNHLNATETIDKDEYYDHARTGPAFKTQSDTNNDDYDHAGPVPSTASAYDDYGI